MSSSRPSPAPEKPKKLSAAENIAAINVTFDKKTDALISALREPPSRAKSERAASKEKLDRFMKSDDCEWTSDQKLVVLKWFRKDQNSASDVDGTALEDLSSLLQYAMIDDD